MKTKILVLFSLAVATISANAVPIATWTFETSIPTTAGPLSPELGSGTGTSVHANGSTVYSNPAGNGSAESWSANFWSKGDYFQFEVSTVGYQDNTVVSWNQTRSSTGPATFDFAYSLNGSSWTTYLNNYVVPSISWSSVTPDATLTTSFSVNLSSLGLNGDASVFFRIIDDTTTGATAGTGRIDNFMVAADVIPTHVPDTGTTAIFLSLPLLGLWTLRRLSLRTA